MLILIDDWLKIFNPSSRTLILKSFIGNRYCAGNYLAPCRAKAAGGWGVVLAIKMTCHIEHQRRYFSLL